MPTPNEYLHDIRYIAARVEEELNKRDISSAVAYIEDIKELCDRLITNVTAQARRNAPN